MAGSYGWSHLRQSVPLVSQLRKMGVNKAVAEKFLDGAPPLAFSVFYGGRSDCMAEVKVSLVPVPGTGSTPDSRFTTQCSVAELDEAEHHHSGIMLSQFPLWSSFLSI